MLALMAPPLARITCTKKYYKIRKEFSLYKHFTIYMYVPDYVSCFTKHDVE